MAEDQLSIAVIDDDLTVVKLVTDRIKKLKCAVTGYTNPEKCWRQIERRPVDILITDIDMPGLDGLELLSRVKGICPSPEVIIITALTHRDVAVQALRRAAFDFLGKPVRADELIETIKRTRRYQAVVRERECVSTRRRLLAGRDVGTSGVNAFVGKSHVLKAAVQQILKLQKFERMSVLLKGESGTGKEIFARAIHHGGGRSAAPFVPVNCAAIPFDLFESVLFGHVKGAFTGAVVDRTGAFVAADGGTLFLDEIGDMHHDMQAKLLRVLEDGVVTPVGDTTEQQVNVRLISATNADIEERVRKGAFREDLFFRIAGYSVAIPPLRDRRGDIPLLARHFVETMSRELELPSHVISPAAMKRLEGHCYPGNIRELKNLIGSALVKSDGIEIRPEHLVFASVDSDQGVSASPSAGPPSGLAPCDLPLNLAAAEKLLVARALKQSHDNISVASRMLGISRQKLYRKMEAAESINQSPGGD
jgi:DNA-binding NtrC family response regulator